MPSSSRSFLSLPFILLLLASTATASSSTNPIASLLCRNSDTPFLCLRISSPLRNVTPLTLTEAAIKIATKVALRAKGKAILLSLSPRLSPQQKSSLETCAESYGDVVDGLQDSANFLAMSSRKKAAVMNYLSAASFGVTVCEDAFRGVSRTTFPLARVNKTLRKYVSNALAMGDQLSLHW